MSAIQTIVNRTPKDKATNELYFRTHSIVLSLYFAPMRLRVRSRRLWLAATPPVLSARKHPTPVSLLTCQTGYVG